MEWSATIFLAFGAGLLLGGLVVGLLQRRSGGAAREHAAQLAIELEEACGRLEEQRAEVARHFEETSGLFRDLTEHYTRLYAHLSEGAREFCTGEMPALGRGFDAPLLGASGDFETAEEPPAEELRAEEPPAEEPPAEEPRAEEPAADEAQPRQSVA